MGDLEKFRKDPSLSCRGFVQRDNDDDNEEEEEDNDDLVRVYPVAEKASTNPNVT